MYKGNVSSNIIAISLRIEKFWVNYFLIQSNVFDERKKSSAFYLNILYVI